jgi:hypothetical protein
VKSTNFGSFRIIYSAERAYEAEIVKSILHAHGIEPVHVPDYSSGLFGVLANLNVAVAQEDVAEAREILQAFGIPTDDPSTTYMPSDIMRTLNNFLPRENIWIKIYAGAMLALFMINMLSMISGWFRSRL